MPGEPSARGFGRRLPLRRGADVRASEGNVATLRVKVQVKYFDLLEMLMPAGWVVGPADYRSGAKSLKIALLAQSRAAPLGAGRAVGWALLAPRAGGRLGATWGGHGEQE